MKQVVEATNLEGVAVSKEQPNRPSPGTEERVHHEGKSREDSRCSLDPMRDTDRYRLVTPYFDSSKDL